MANIFAPSEQAFDKLDHKSTHTGDSCAVSAAQDAYKLGTKVDTHAKSPIDKLHSSGNALEITPLWNHPESNNNAMSGSETGGKDSGWKAYEALNLGVKAAPVNEPKANLNAMRGSEKGADKSGWKSYEALDLKDKPLAKPCHAVEHK